MHRTMTDMERELALALWKLRVVRTDPIGVTLEGLPEMQLRTIATLAARCIQFMTTEKRIMFDAVAGVPGEGTALAEALALLTGKSCIEGLGLWGEDANQKVTLVKKVPAGVKHTLIVSGVLYDGKVEGATFDILRMNFGKPGYIVVLVDHELGGPEELIYRPKCYRNPDSLFNVSDLLMFGQQENFVDAEAQDAVEEYLTAQF